MVAVQVADLVKEKFGEIRTEFDETRQKFQTALGEQKQELQDKLDELSGKMERCEKFIAAHDKVLIPGFDAHERRKLNWNNLVIVAFKAWRLPGCGHLYDLCGAERALIDEFHANHMPHMDKKFLDSVNVRAPISSASDESGAILVPMELMADIIPELEAMEVNAQLGVVQVFGLVGDVTWPKDQGGIAASYIDTEIQENIPKTSSTFKGVTGRPHPMAALVDLTWSVVRQSAVNAEAFTRNRIAKKIALREDLSVFTGTGSGEPLGVKNLTGKQTFDFATDPVVGTTPQYGYGAGKQNISDAIRQSYGKMRSADVMMDETMGLVTSAQGYDKIFGTVNEDAMEIFTQQDGNARERIQGGRVLWSTQLRNTDEDEQAFVGTWSNLYNLHWGTLALAASDVAGDNFKNVSLSVRGVIAHDVVSFHDEAFVEWLNFDLAAAG